MNLVQYSPVKPQFHRNLYLFDGRLSQRIWARGIVTDYSYDGWGSLTNTVYSDGTPTVTHFYDAMGRQTDALKECKRQHLESQINQTKKRPQENNFSPFVTTSQNAFESFIRIPSFEEMGGVVIDKGVEHTSIVANQCKCCEIMIVSREWREYESGGTEYGIVQVNLHNRSCEDLKNQAKLVRKIPGVSVSFVYESDF